MKRLVKVSDEVGEESKGDVTEQGTL
jgi:hypothetical protein